MGGSIPISLIDAPLDFDEMAKLGAPIGAGGLFGDGRGYRHGRGSRATCSTFWSRNPCGKCVPCREGMYQTLKILTNIKEGKGRKFDLERLADLIEVTSLGSFVRAREDLVRSAEEHAALFQG